MNPYWQIYGLTLIAGALLASAGAGLGFHLFARGRALETLVQAQGAALGTLFGLALFSDHHEIEAALSLRVVATALLTGLLFGLLAKRLGRQASRRAPFQLIGLQLLLGALAQVFDAHFLKVDSHLAQVYFGDLVTLSERDAVILGGISFFTLVFLLWQGAGLERRSVERSLGLRRPWSRAERRTELGFELILILTTALSVQFLGTLFTVSVLLLPGLVVAGLRAPPTPRRLLWSLSLIAALATVGAFALSLSESGLPTTPLITLFLALLGLLFRVRQRASRAP